MALPVQVLGQATRPLTAGVLFDATGLYESAMTVFAAIAIIAAVLVLAARPPCQPRTAWMPWQFVGRRLFAFVALNQSVVLACRAVGSMTGGLPIRSCLGDSSTCCIIAWRVAWGRSGWLGAESFQEMASSSSSAAIRQQSVSLARVPLD